VARRPGFAGRTRLAGPLDADRSDACRVPPG